jgi:hypothetical protein
MWIGCRKMYKPVLAGIKPTINIPCLRMQSMRLAIMALLGLLVSGCLQTGGGGTGGDYHKNLTAAQLKPFLDAGCVASSYTYLDCSNASFASQFNCLSPSMQVKHEGAGLEPPLPLIECLVEGYDLNGTKTSGYFFCGGGMLRACTSYIAWEGGKFVQIKNMAGLAAKAAPISSEAEAINYVLLSKDVIDAVERPGLGDLAAKAEKNAGGFLVTAYHYNPFGCYSKIDYEEVKFQVSADGRIEEKGREVVYSKDLGYAICVD